MFPAANQTFFVGDLLAAGMEGKAGAREEYQAASVPDRELP